MLRALFVIVALLGADAFATPRYPRATPNIWPPEAVRPLPAMATTVAPSLAAIDVAPATAFARLVVLPESPTAQHLFDYAMTTATRSREVKATNPNLSKQEMLFAFKAFKALVDTHRDFPQLDAALFHFGQLLLGAKYIKDAGQVFDKLVKDYPASPFVVTSQVVLGDHYFATKQFTDAAPRYRMVLGAPKSALHAYATYKLAWMHMLLQQYPQALEAMSQAVTLTRGARTPLARAARTDYVLAFAEAGDAQKALGMLKRIDPPRALELYAQLAASYAARGLFDRAVLVYRDLANHAPAQACNWHTLEVRALLQLPMSAMQVRTAVDAVVKAAATSNDATCRANAVALQSLDMRRYLAEIAWVHGDWTVAGKAFADIASDTRTPHAIALDAALASVLAYKNALDVESDRAILARRSARTLTPLTANEAAMLAAHAMYATLVDDTDRELATMRFVEAATLRGHGDHEAAVPLLLAYLRMNPDSIDALRMLEDSRESMASSPHEKDRGVRNRSGR